MIHILYPLVDIACFFVLIILFDCFILGWYSTVYFLNLELKVILFYFIGVCCLGAVGNRPYRTSAQNGRWFWIYPDSYRLLLKMGRGFSTADQNRSRSGTPYLLYNLQTWLSKKDLVWSGKGICESSMCILKYYHVQSWNHNFLGLCVFFVCCFTIISFVSAQHKPLRDAGHREECDGGISSSNKWPGWEDEPQHQAASL